MNSIVISDHKLFQSFVAGEAVEQTAICPADHAPDFAVGKLVEVWLEATSVGKPHYAGKVVANLGYVPSLPPTDPPVIMIRVEKLGAKGLVGR